jgi:hypothetical protein
MSGTTWPLTKPLLSDEEFAKVLEEDNDVGEMKGLEVGDVLECLTDRFSLADGWMIRALGGVGDRVVDVNHLLVSPSLGYALAAFTFGFASVSA